MAYTPYYAPYSRPIGYYNPSIPQENPNMQNGQQFQQMPIQQQIPMQAHVQQMPIVQPTPTNDMLFVLNETEATAYPVAPNNSVTLWADTRATAVIPRTTIIPNEEWAEDIQEMRQPTTLCANSVI